MDLKWWQHCSRRRVSRVQGWHVYKKIKSHRFTCQDIVCIQFEDDGDQKLHGQRKQASHQAKSQGEREEKCVNAGIQQFYGHW